MKKKIFFEWFKIINHFYYDDEELRNSITFDLNLLNTATTRQTKTTSTTTTTSIFQHLKRVKPTIFQSDYFH